LRHVQRPMGVIIFYNPYFLFNRELTFSDHFP
jgi:hypothetical protein